MDTPKGPDSDFESQNPISTCASMLSLRHFSAVRDFARRLPLSDSLSRILAIADVLSASDHYSVLQLRRTEALDRDLARRQYAKLAILLDPTSTDKFPFSDEALARVREAWHVLSDPQRRSLYDLERRPISVDTTASFWTACPYCWNLYQYEKKYEGCSLMCQSCRKAFHGVAVKPPVKKGGPVVVGEERRQYYWCRASVPLKYYEMAENESGNMMGETENSTQFVYISDDDVDGDGGFGKVDGNIVRNEGLESVIQGNNGTVGGLQGNGKRKMRIKTVAKRTKGNRMARCLDNDSDLDLDLDFGAEDGELEFTEGDDDVFVGVRFDR